MADHDISPGVPTACINGDRYIFHPGGMSSGVRFSEQYSKVVWQLEGTCGYAFERRVPGATTWQACLAYPGATGIGATTGANGEVWDQDAAGVEVACRITSGTPTMTVSGEAR